MGNKNTVYLLRQKLLDSLKRLSLFYSKIDNPVCYLKFSNDGVTLYDKNKVNNEFLYFINNSINCDYECSLNINDLRLTLENSSDMYITMSFGNKEAIVVSKGQIFNIIPELSD